MQGRMQRYQISIHAPTRGATQFRIVKYIPNHYFNPRSHEGSDVVVGLFGIKIMISIHAPTRGATLQSQQVTDILEFQSTLPRGERPIPMSINSATPLFQSTLPRGERCECLCKITFVGRFQSTLPRGERRNCNFHVTPPYNNFNPRSHEGSDSNYRLEQEGERYFNPRSHEGSDYFCSISSSCSSGFQSTLPRGERPTSTISHCNKQQFQSTLPRGERLPPVLR